MKKINKGVSWCRVAQPTTLSVVASMVVLPFLFRVITEFLPFLIRNRKAFTISSNYASSNSLSLFPSSPCIPVYKYPSVFVNKHHQIILVHSISSLLSCPVLSCLLDTCLVSGLVLFSSSPLRIPVPRSSPDPSTCMDIFYQSHAPSTLSISCSLLLALSYVLGGYPYDDGL